MTTEGGGWTRIEYKEDLPYKNHFTNGDGWRWMTSTFKLVLTSAQIKAIQAVSTEGRQKYVGRCHDVMHYQTTTSSDYQYAFGFRMHTGKETPSGTKSYSPWNIKVLRDICRNNGSAGENGKLTHTTDFMIRNVGLPVINVRCKDCGDSSEKFGSPLKANPAWLR